MHILRHTSLFVPLVNGSYRQVSGIPVYELDKLPPPSKKRKRTESSVKGSLSKPSNSEILLSRSSIFYANLTKTQAASSGLSAHRKARLPPPPALGDRSSPLQTSSSAYRKSIRKRPLRNTRVILRPPDICPSTFGRKSTAFL